MRHSDEKSMSVFACERLTLAMTCDTISSHDSPAEIAGEC